MPLLSSRSTRPLLWFLLRERSDALFIAPEGFFASPRSSICHARQPAIRYPPERSFATREMVEAAGLMSYGGNFRTAIRLAGVYAGRILKEEKPADLPVQQATKVEFHQPQDRQGARPHVPRRCSPAPTR